MAAPANRPAARVAIISSNICAESFLSSSPGDHKVAATATATNDAAASIKRPRCPRNQRARISSIAFASAGGVATIRRWSGTRIAIDAARVTKKPAAPTDASTRAKPSAARANPAAETIAATSKAGCTLSVRRSVSSKSPINSCTGIRRQIGTRDHAKVAAPPANNPPATSMRLAQMLISCLLSVVARTSEGAHDLVEGRVVGRRVRRHRLELGTCDSRLEVLRGLPLGDIHEAEPWIRRHRAVKLGGDEARLRPHEVSRPAPAFQELIVVYAFRHLEGIDEDEIRHLAFSFLSRLPPIDAAVSA